MSRPQAGHVLVADAGSHSLRLRLFAPDGTAVARHESTEPPGADVPERLRDLLAGTPRPTAAGHRIVHGGPDLARHTVVDGTVRAALEEAAELAPLHVPPALAVLDAARDALPGIPHVACLDTAFHATMPPAAREYALPRVWRERFGVRRYGFHGLSYAWALARTAELLRRPPEELNLVVAHLGGGCSACAVRGGRGVDTTMGFTPLEGLVMTRRSGTVDPGALLWLQQRHGLSATFLDECLNHRSGLLALSGTSDDTRDLVRARADGDEAAGLALEVFVHHCRRGIAAMAASLERLDALVFTGEIGADQPEVREEICSGLPVLGLTGGLPVPDGVPDDPVFLRPPGPGTSGVPVVLVPTGEDRQVAAETRAALAA
jgi:acetate kinase